MALTNAEKQARYREHHLGVDGAKVRIGLNLNAGIRAKMDRLARRCGYTITSLVEELVERAEWRGRQGCRPARSRPITAANDPSSPMARL
jgi:hypothetical protein